MRGSLIKALRAEFEKSLKQRLNSARRLPIQPSTSVSTAWLIAEDANATAYIILVIHNQMDEFAIEVAWSRQKRIPPKQDLEPGEPSKSDESRFRLSRLWRRHGWEVWYDLSHDEDLPQVLATDPFPDPFEDDESRCLQRLPIKVQHALDAFEQHAIPYLTNVVSLRAS